MTFGTDRNRVKVLSLNQAVYKLKISFMWNLKLLQKAYHKVFELKKKKKFKTNWWCF